MRGIDTQVRKTRRAIFREVANMAYNSKNLVEDMEALPYKLVDAENSPYWDNIYREREIVRERTRLAMGMSLRPEDEPVQVSQGIEESNIDEKYYERLITNNFESRKNALFFSRDRLYKLAGNSIVVNMLEAIFEQVFEIKTFLDKNK